MANRSYLVGCDFPETCPAIRWPGFDNATHVLATDSCAIPLLWLSAFRPADLRQSSIRLDDGSVWTDLSPITTVTQASKQVEQALPALNELFRNHGSFESYVATFRRLLSDVPGTYLSLDLSEIAALSEPGHFARVLIKALNTFQRHASDSAPLGEWDLDPRAMVPPAPTLRGKRAVAFLVAQTGEPKKVVERVLENCRGDVAKALGFFKWQAAQSDAVSVFAQQSDWSVLAELAGLRLHRRFPDANETNFAHRDDEWNHCRLLGCSYLRPVPWECDR